MTDNITPPLAPSTPPPKGKFVRNEFNQAYLKEIANARKVLLAAKDPANVAPLTDVDLNPATVGLLFDALDDAEKALAKLTGTRAGKKAITAQEKIAREAILTALGPIQTAARRKFSAGDELQREAYFIGTALSNEGLAEVLTAARAVRDRLTPGPNNTPPVDVLPGIKPAKQVKNLADAIIAYGGKDEEQGKQIEASEKELEAIEAMIADIAKLRRDIQLAADQAWPWRTKGVTTLRKSFLLPTDRPLTNT